MGNLLRVLPLSRVCASRKWALSVAPGPITTVLEAWSPPAQICLALVAWTPVACSAAVPAAFSVVVLADAAATSLVCNVRRHNEP